MEKNQSEQQFYLSNLGSPSIISPAQFPCTVIGSSKTTIHTIVPNSNTSLNFNSKYQNASNDFKVAQNLPTSNAHNCYTNPPDELKFLFSNSNKNKKHYIKRNSNLKTPSQCLNSNDNSSDITAAPNQLTILVQEVLPAQVPDNPILTTSTIQPHLNSTHMSIKAHSSNIISASQLNEKIDLSVKMELTPEKREPIFTPLAKDSEVLPQATIVTDVRDTISEVIKEVLRKAISSDPHEDVFLSVIKSRENVSRSLVEITDGFEMSSSMSSPILSQTPENTLIQSSVQNSLLHQRHSDPMSIQQCRPPNFIHPQFVNQNDFKPITNDFIKSNLLAQSFAKSDFYSANCQINQKPNLVDDPSLHSNLETGSKNSNKRKNPTVSKSCGKKQKLSEPVFHEKLNIPMQRCQQSMVKLLGTPNFRKLVHEPRIKNNLTVLAPLGCKPCMTQCTDIIQLQDNCVKYKRVPFTMPQLNPIHLHSNCRSSENSFILQNINASIPEGSLLSTHESDDIDCLIAPSPSNNELDYLSVFNSDPISSPSVSLSAGPNLEMLHPLTRSQSPQLSVFHCPNKDYLKFDNNDSLPSRKFDPQSVMRPTGISRVQISHKYSSVPATIEPIPDNALIDSETGEIVSKPVNDQTRPNKPREKLLMTFTINPPDDVEKTVRNITDVLGIDYSSVEFKETTRGGEIAIDKDSIVTNSIPREICERYNTSVVVNSKIEPTYNSSITTPRPFDTFSSSCLDKTELPLYSEKVYKSTSLVNKPLHIKCSNCEKLISDQKIGSNNNVLCDRIKYRDLCFCDENCQQEHSMAPSTVGSVTTTTNDDDTNPTNFNNNNSIKCPADWKDQCIFIGDDISSEASVIVQGSISKSKQISKRLGALINDKLMKKKASILPPQSQFSAVKSSQKVHKGSKYTVFHSLPASQPDLTSSIISESQFNKLSAKHKSILRRGAITDKRSCCLCQRAGDLHENGPGRLLCLDVDKWLHANCALWCNNVFEMQCGALNNVPDSFESSLKSTCSACGKPGAGIACYYPRCSGKYHVPCAQDQGCLFFADRAMYCQLHQTRDLGPHLTTLNVDRRVYISRDELSQVARTINTEDENFFLRIGSLVVLNIGQLLPHQIHSGHFHNMNHVYPTGFKSRRIHWSSRVLNSRSVYECEILTDNDMPLFKVTARDDNLDKEVYVGPSCSEAWRKIIKKIANLRKSNKVVKFFPEHIKAEDLYGLTEPHVLRCIESLPGLESLNDYAFKFGKMQLIVEMPLPVNSSGSIRTEPFVKLYRHAHKPAIHQSPTPMRQLLATKQDNSLYNKTTLSSKWQQYRKLKVETKMNVVLKRSKIQGFGLYAAKDIEKGTMIIEYVGELIRNEVANKREKNYESKKQGIYMFRLDPSTVIDATRAGDLARYINHCCDPNCFTEVLDFEKESHIVIIANRRIDKGEEMTYDYKFDLDDGKDDKIPCLCGARNCKRWMN